MAPTTNQADPTDRGDRPTGADWGDSDRPTPAKIDFKAPSFERNERKRKQASR